MYLNFLGYADVLSSVLTFLVVILCVIGSDTIALPPCVLVSGLGLGAGTEYLGIVL